MSAAASTRDDAQYIVELFPYFNNKGISRTCAPEGDGLDGLGTVLWPPSLPESRLLVSCHGVDFAFPDPGAACDNIACEGQRITLPAGRCGALHLLALADWRPFEEAFTLHYADGAQVRALLGVSDASCYGGPCYGEREALRCKLMVLDSIVPHAYLFGAPMPSGEYRMKAERMEARIWHQSLRLERAGDAAAVELPDNPSLHIFSLTLTTAKKEH